MKRLCLCNHIIDFWLYYRDNFLREKNTFDIRESDCSIFNPDIYRITDNRSEIEVYVYYHVEEPLFPIEELKRFMEMDVFR